MQFFLLDEDRQVNATYYMNCHTSKIPTEAAQLVCTALHHFGIPTRELPFRPLKRRHPWIAFCKQSIRNTYFLAKYSIPVAREYGCRYGKMHVSELVLQHCLKLMMRSINNADCSLLFNTSSIIEEAPYPTIEWQPREGESKIDTYRRYYVEEKSHLARWKYPSIVPEWYEKLKQQLKEEKEQC